MGLNCYSKYDVSQISFQNESYFDLKFLAKFILNNKESIETLSLKDVSVDDLGLSFAPKLSGFSFGPDLQNLHIENMNFSKKGLKYVIQLCRKMNQLKELALINLEAMKTPEILN